jgi:Zn-dependent protease/predicted transcriptional regulator
MFGKSIKLFKLFGFQVNIDLSWLVLAILVTWSLAMGYFPYRYAYLSQTTYWIMGAFGAVGLFLSIVLHELGHSLVSRKQGMPMKGITLFIFGGVAEMTDEPPTASSEFFMAIIGPIISVVLGAAFYVIYLIGEQFLWPVPVSGIFYYLGWINGLLAVFNMLPAFPLDGGRVLRSFLWRRNGNLRKSTQTASKIGAGFGAGLIALGVLSFLFGNFIGGMWWFLLGMFLRNAAKASFKQLEIRNALKGEPIEHFMNRNPVSVPADISIEDLVRDYVYTYHFRMFPVMSDSSVLGCISTKQVKDIPREEWGRHSVREILIPCSKDNAVAPDTDAMDVLTILQRTGNSRLLVMDRDRLEGVVSLKDLLRFLALKLDLEGDAGEDLLPPHRRTSSSGGWHSD